MLEIIRKNVRHPWIQAMLGIVIFVFILFFGWSMSSQKPTYVAKVNGDTVEYRAYQQAYDGLMRVYQEAFGAQASPEKLRELGLGRRALDQLVDQILLTQEADRRDLKITDDELQASIQALPVFQEGGRFLRERYLRVLEANRITPQEFEGQKRRELLLGKVEQALRAEARVDDAELRKEYDARNTKADVDFVAYDPAALRQALKPAEAELKAYYEAQKESFRAPEKRIGRYVLFAPDAYAASAAVTDQELQQEFGTRAEQLVEKEAVRARHILLKVEPGAKPEDEARVRRKAEALLKEAKATKDFAALARKNSDDPGSRDKGGDLGFFERGQMVPEFEAAAFALKPGQVSDLVKSSFGYHIIRVEEHRQGGQATLEALRPKLEAAVKRRKALEQAYQAADRALMDLEDKKETWEGLGKKHPVVQTAAVARGEPVAGVGKPLEFGNLLFSLDPAKAGNLLETDQGTYLVAVDKALPPSVPPFEEVRAQVDSRFREAEGKKLAEKKAADLLAAAKKDGWDAAVKAAGAKAEKTGPFPKKGGTVGSIGWSEELRAAAFALPRAGAVADKPVTANGKVYAFRLTTLTPADPAGFEMQKESLRSQLLPAKQGEHVQEALKKLRAEAKIKINEDLLL